MDLSSKSPTLVAVQTESPLAGSVDVTTSSEATPTHSVADAHDTSDKLVTCPNGAT
jgi:hypothetical protein